MLNKDLFSNRLQELMVHYELSAAGLADSIGIQRSSISHLLSGRNKPSLDFILKILEKYPAISFEWFVKGVGSIENTSATARQSNATPTLFEQEANPLITKKQEKETPTNPFKERTGSKVLAKVLLLYTDGSFDVYKE